MGYKAGEVKKAILASTRLGSNRTQAMTDAAKLLGITKGTPKTSNRVLPKAKVEEFFNEIKHEHLVKSNIGGHNVSGMTAKGLARTAVEAVEQKEERPDARTAAKERLAEKEKILKEAGVERKPIIQKALDTSYIDERNKAAASEPAPAQHRPTIEPLKPAPVIPPPAAPLEPGDASKAIDTPI